MTAGRGTLTAWLRRANLGVGESVREPVLDMRETFERIRDITLRRDPDRIDDITHEHMRVYTLLGRETVFADEHDVVIGDLMGLRRHEALPPNADVHVPPFPPLDPARPLR